jgi:Ca-activated chloride channel family protein
MVPVCRVRKWFCELYTLLVLPEWFIADGSPSELVLPHPVLPSVHGRPIVFSKLASILQQPSSNLFLTGATFKGRVVENIVLWNITQQFQNKEKQPVELLYHFPLGAMALLVSATARIGSRQFTCEVQARQQARMDYTEAVANGDSAILIEQDDELRYFMRIGNIMPGEKLDIHLQTAEFLQLAHGSARIAVPTCLPNSYSLAGDHSEHAVVVSPRQKHTLKAELRLTGSTRQGRVVSPSHKLRISHAADCLLIEVAGDAFLDRDFVLNIDELNCTVPTGFWFHNPQVGPDLPGAYVGMLNCMFPQESFSTQGLQLKLLLDCSGSMEGGRMVSAKSALKCLATQLHATDRISFSRFGSHCENLLDATTLATPQVRNGLSRWVDETEANLGGTEMAQALAAVARISNTGQADVLLITDGEVDGLAAMVEAAVETTHRIFVLAIGASPQESLLSTLARATGGAVEFVQQDSDIEAAMIRLFKTLRNPTYTGVRLHCEGLIEQTQVAPEFGFEGCSFPVLFSSNAPAFAVAMHVEKRIRNRESRPELSSILLRLLDEPELAKAVSKLWAAQRFESLMDQERLKPGAFEKDATELAVRFGLVTPLTSACLTLLRDEDERNTDMPVRHAVHSMVAVDSSAHSTGVFFSRRSSASTSNRGFESTLLDYSSSSLIDHVPCDSSRSPAECIQALAELPKHLRPRTFDDLLVLGFPEEVIEWCKKNLADLLLLKGEAAVVERVLEMLVQGLLGKGEWMVDRND